MHPLKKHSYPSDSVGAHMATRLPVGRIHEPARTIIQNLSKSEWDNIEFVYILDNDDVLVGYVDVRKLFAREGAHITQSFLEKIPVTLHPWEDVEKSVYEAVKNDSKTIPVVDENNRFLGAVLDSDIVDIMHNEHVEDALLTAGVHSNESNIVRLATERTFLVLGARAPWLIFGALIGIGLGFVSSLFEHQLEKTVALAYFVPVVAYIADSVGTQSEAITVRALATLKIRYASYLIKELLVGMVLGLLVGLMGFLGAVIVSHETSIGLVVGISLFVASTIAALLASAIPIIFKMLGKDPALGSGPIATALQDVFSVFIYFVIAFVLLR